MHITLIQVQLGTQHALFRVLYLRKQPRFWVNLITAYFKMHIRTARALPNLWHENHRNDSFSRDPFYVKHSTL